MRKLILLLSLSLLSFCALGSEAVNWQMGFQKSATYLMDQIINLYHFVMYILIGVVIVVFGTMAYICVKFNSKANPSPAKFDNNLVIEIIWTTIPIVLLIIMAVPSFELLKEIQKVPKADMTVKVVGHQWYWRYIYPDHQNIEFESYMIQDKDLEIWHKRLLDVDNRLVVPIDSVVRFIITGADVIHSFSVPSAGIKVDAIPGRMNETWIKFREKGVYYGQCSELCGANHGFMPIVIEVVSKEDFDSWSAEIIKNK